MLQVPQTVYLARRFFLALDPISFETRDSMGIRLSDAYARKIDDLIGPDDTFRLSGSSQKVTYRLRVSDFTAIFGLSWPC